MHFVNTGEKMAKIAPKEKTEKWKKKLKKKNVSSAEIKPTFFSISPTPFVKLHNEVIAMCS